MYLHTIRLVCQYFCMDFLYVWGCFWCQVIEKHTHAHIIARAHTHNHTHTHVHNHTHARARTYTHSLSISMLLRLMWQWLRWVLIDGCLPAYCALHLPLTQYVHTYIHTYMYVCILDILLITLTRRLDPTWLACTPTSVLHVSLVWLGSMHRGRQ
jgi:hypothetical protein